uniref:Dynein axonemal intermediate chain 7 n=1 Tax=Hucho hucho TaxID=62062 RepID=A0A4W5MJX2_9TELE
EENQTAVAKCVTDSRANAKWDRDMRCDGSPDPSVQQEINTFINLWWEDPEVQIKPVALRLLEELKGMLRDQPEPADYFQFVTVLLSFWLSRFKGFQFEEVGLGFALPKQLAVSDVAVRILHTHNDHLSHLANLKSQTPSRMSLGLGASEELTSGCVCIRVCLCMCMCQSVMSVMSMKEERRSGQKQLEEKGSQIDTMLFGDDSDSSPTPMDPVIDSYEGQVVDLQQYTPLGGVFYCDVFRLQPQSQTLNGWEMRELLDTGLQPFPYPKEQSQIQGSASMKLEDSRVLTCPPVGVTVTLPDSVLFLEDPQVACWDPEGQHWKTDCINETYEAELKISFKVVSFYAFTLLQDSYANMPFQSWELRPLGQDSALLTITGSKCMLQSDQERGLNHILSQWMSPSGLQKAMVSTGVNIFVNQYSDKCQRKRKDHAVYEQMALLSSAFAWSQGLVVCVPAGGPEMPEAEDHSGVFSPELDPGSEFHSTFLHML